MYQDVDVTADPADSCALFITVHSHSATQKRPALSARFQFEDHIRCVAARQCLQRNRDSLRWAKMARIAKLLHLPTPESPQPTSQTVPIPRSGSHIMIHILHILLLTCVGHSTASLPVGLHICTLTLPTHLPTLPLFSPAPLQPSTRPPC